jgi:DNA-binding response OmpR family regulator
MLRNGSAGRHRILLVEDHTDTADALTIPLEEQGHQVVLTRTLADARKACLDTKRRFDFVLCDIGLPDGDGRELASIVRAHSPDVKLVALTGLDMDDQVAGLQPDGFHLTLMKPVSTDELFELADSPGPVSTSHLTYPAFGPRC